MTWAPTDSEIDVFIPNALSPWSSFFKQLAPSLIEHYDMVSLEWCHFAGQMGHETNGLSLANMRENMNFRTARRILQVYRYRLNLCLNKVNSDKEDEPAWVKGKSVDYMAQYLIGKPEELARIVYGGREGTPWYQGHLYIGRGPTQITHKDNYEAISNEIAKQPNVTFIDLVAKPELLEEPEWGVRSAFADWHIKGLRKYALADQTDRVSAALNTGSPNRIDITNGLQSRRLWTNKAKRIWL